MKHRNWQGASVRPKKGLSAATRQKVALWCLLTLTAFIVASIAAAPRVFGGMRAQEYRFAEDSIAGDTSAAFLRDSLTSGNLPIAGARAIIVQLRDSVGSGAGTTDSALVTYWFSYDGTNFLPLEPGPLTGTTGAVEALDTLHVRVKGRLHNKALSPSLNGGWATSIITPLNAQDAASDAAGVPYFFLPNYFRVVVKPITRARASSVALGNAALIGVRMIVRVVYNSDTDISNVFPR